MSKSSVKFNLRSSKDVKKYADNIGSSILGSNSVSPRNKKKEKSL
jgi:hypothetical protein